MPRARKSRRIDHTSPMRSSAPEAHFGGPPRLAVARAWIRSARNPKRQTRLVQLRAFARIRSTFCVKFSGSGRVAQLGERLVRNEEVRGSSPLTSTIIVIVPPAFGFLYAVYLSIASSVCVA